MWIKSLQKYSTFTETIYLHYNIHTFPISTLILNTPIFAIHLNTIFMVISSNQNLYFKIQCKKTKNEITFYDIFYTIDNSHNNMNIEIIAKKFTSLVY